LGNQRRPPRKSAISADLSVAHHLYSLKTYGRAGRFKEKVPTLRVRKKEIGLGDRTPGCRRERLVTHFGLITVHLGKAAVHSKRIVEERNVLFSGTELTDEGAREAQRKSHQVRLSRIFADQSSQKENNKYTLPEY